MNQQRTSIYSTELSKGQGAVAETFILLEYWQPGMTSGQLAQRVLEEGILARSTARRVNDLVKSVFGRRYLDDNGQPAMYLKRLVEARADPALIKQILLIYTARAHPILRDFIAEVYWARYAAGAETLDRAAAEEFIYRAQADGRIAPPWSPAMIERVAGYLTGTLADFGLLQDVKKSTRPLKSYRLLTDTILFLAHEIHFRGFGDTSILESPDWKLFGLTRGDVVQELERVARGRHFIVQYSGDLLRIAWQYHTMEECLDAIAGK